MGAAIYIRGTMNEWLPSEGSNLDNQLQRLASYH